MARELSNLGWPDVHPLEGGFDAWVRAHYPVVPKSDAEGRVENRGPGSDARA